MANSDEFIFELDAGTFNLVGGNPAGNFSVDGSKAHFGSAELSPAPIPETDVIFLILIGIAIPLIRHRRRTP